MLPPAQPQHGQQAPPRQITSSPDTAAAGPSIVRVLEAGIIVRVSEKWAVTCHVSYVTCHDSTSTSSSQAKPTQTKLLTKPGCGGIGGVIVLTQAVWKIFVITEKIFVVSETILLPRLKFLFLERQLPMLRR